MKIKYISCQIRKCNRSYVVSCVRTLSYQPEHKFHSINFIIQSVVFWRDIETLSGVVIETKVCYVYVNLCVYMHVLYFIVQAPYCNNLVIRSNFFSFSFCVTQRKNCMLSLHVCTILGQWHYYCNGNTILVTL